MVRNIRKEEIEKVEVTISKVSMPIKPNTMELVGRSMRYFMQDQLMLCNLH